jgi:hypothetical protein
MNSTRTIAPATIGVHQWRKVRACRQEAGARAPKRRIIGLGVSPSRAEQALTVCDRVAMERGRLTDDARAAADGEWLMAAITV